jgi:DNA-binding transcriptional LysR family regulator
MNNYQLKTFACVAEQGSFNKASEILFTSKQALIKQIETLENELELTLFLRSNRGVILTNQGKKFFEGLKKITREMQSLIEDCKALDTNEVVIKIGSPPHPKLPLEAAMNEFSIRFPGVKQEIVFFKLFENPVKGLLDNTYDIVAGSLRHKYLAKGISYTHMMFQPCYCLMVESNPLAKRENVSLKDISGYRIGLIRKKGKMDIIAELETLNPDVSITECEGDETQFILNFCFTGGIYISKVYYTHTLTPLAAIPLKPDFADHVVAYYRKDPSGVLAEFVKAIEKIYPQEN